MSRNRVGDRHRVAGRSTGSRWMAYDDYLDELMNGMRMTYLTRREGRSNDTTDSSSSRSTINVSSDAEFEKKALKVQSVDMHVAQNAKDHHTSSFELVEGYDPVPILRRGQDFYFTIKFNRKINVQMDIIKLNFIFGLRPMARKGTSVDLNVHFGQKKFSRVKGKWDVRIHDISGNMVTLQVKIPASVGVGEWKLNINTVLGLYGLTEEYKHLQHIYILFNPWSKDDAVYMESETMRKEYVLNDVGKIFVGTYKKQKGRRWVFGQFDDAVLPSCMFILGMSQLDYTARSNPVKVVRLISAMVNAQDDNGVLVGNWSGEYDDGTAPWSWTGSAAILEEYLENGGRPVNYGQCWVFSGVTTTICRALGIPCRSVSNFVSAHDTDETITVDKFFDSDGDEIEEAADSIWNFHVWNDCWMARPDLPPGYGGWQAIDATPQETSDGTFRAGPASLIAIRRGQIGFLYDTTFLFSEVNADVMYWQQDKENEIGWKKMKSHKYHVGRCILTKKCDIDDDQGEADACDITSEYKNSEGSVEERMSVLNAARCGGLSYLYDMPTATQEDVHFDLVDIDSIMIGQAFNIRVRVKNRAREPRTINMVLSTSTLYYTGVRANKIRREKHAFVLSAGQEESLRLTISGEEYLDKLVDHAMMKIYAIATVQETKQTWAEEDDFLVEKPKPTIKIKGPVRLGRSFEIEVRFTNPLKTKLERSEFTFEGPGLSKRRSVKIREVRPEETIVHYERFIPRNEGTKKIVVGFNSRQLSDMVASKQVDVMQ